MPDCNFCLNINISEEEQDNGEPHICKHYGKRVLHKTFGKVYSGYLYPCKECKNDGYFNYRIE